MKNNYLKLHSALVDALYDYAKQITILLDKAYNGDYYVEYNIVLEQKGWAIHLYHEEESGLFDGTTSERYLGDITLYIDEDGIVKGYESFSEGLLEYTADRIAEQGESEWVTMAEVEDYVSQMNVLQRQMQNKVGLLIDGEELV
jgi:hypothetical protein